MSFLLKKGEDSLDIAQAMSSLSHIASTTLLAIIIGI